MTLPYYPPIRPATGALHQQPRVDARRPDWCLDRNLNYQDAGFLDAPDILPSGSVRALDFLSCTLGIAHVLRETQG